MMEIKNLSSNQRFLLNVLVPSLYLLPLVLAYLGPKNFGFGHDEFVYVGLAIGAVGVILWVLAMFTLGPSLAVLPGTDKLVTRGVYRYLRHPIYIGIILTLGGLFLACGSTICLVYVFAVVVPLNIFRARSEEKALQEQLGESYQQYRAITYF
ncbi:MAG: isoprenylcysteine carboxylmethyltransferase family protein [Nitrospinae bacterium]|nr:isoprenylcysteine carboxylmethyltransferase family protein [Nitrospinota bacterium]